MVVSGKVLECDVWWSVGRCWSVMVVVSGKMLECDVWWSVGRCWSVMCGGQWEGGGV